MAKQHTTPTMGESRKTVFVRVQTMFMEMFGLSRTVAAAATLFVGSVTAIALFWFFHSAPPRTIIITTGTAGSSFQVNAEKYQKILASNGVTLKILPSQGSLENLERLQNHSFKVDVGFVQSGVTNENGIGKLVSLGSIGYQPLFIFYRCAEPITLLSQLAGKRVAVGPVGSGTHTLALTLLQTNGIVPGGPTTLLDLDGEAAAKALFAGTADAIFLMGDSASPTLLKQLLLNPDIHLYDFIQADAYARKISYLNKLELPQGSLDFGKNLPSHDVYLVGPTLDLIAQPDLHPALSDLLLEAAREVHGNASILKRRGEFPAPLEHDFPISADALRFYKSGKSLLYRHLPFWLASLLNRVLVAFVPMIVVLVPSLRIIPNMYKWRIRLLIYRWYRALLTLEREAVLQMTPDKRQECFTRLDHIEKAVNRMKVPASFADQFYGLRGHIDYVRDRLVQNPQSN